ncbi:SIR2 family protein [Parahaliea mediterranea]|uniref:SIR2 family protein n=1 Tax=Parahaliea mediterranea TaxID=651086 RepID=A0A939IJ38_9GAMM|nr:SIR2 family protein [Parahaliea mediterranea]MBN7795871.1 SIR2 family protein [Parahaliea mediterranea]
MNQQSVHNPDRYMIDLRQIISQGKKRIGILVGAGAPVSVRVDEQGKLADDGSPLIPDVAALTKFVLEQLEEGDKAVIEKLLPELDSEPNIETILTQIRRLSQAIGSAQVHGIDGQGYHDIAGTVCEKIGERVATILPEEQNPYTELVSWIGGTQREHPVEIFTPNYDLLLEEAFERAQLPYFDGFSGSHKPFFDPTTVTENSLPARWSRLWKIHGSLGWEIENNTVIRTGERKATHLIYPDHLKYDQISRQPYSALFERLREFLTTPDSLLLCTGFSFFDAHISAVIDEALAANTHTAVLAFQFKKLEDEPYAVKIATRRPNMSVYGNDGAVISGISGRWKVGDPPSDEWIRIRETFWDASKNDGSGAFVLGDFARLTRFFAQSHATDFSSRQVEVIDVEEQSDDEVDDVKP